MYQSGVTIKNESEVPLLAVLSQLSPLHWNNQPINPGEVYKINSGRVWFTLSANAWDPWRKPSAIGVAARISVISVGAVLVGVTGFVVTSVVSGVTSTVSRTRTSKEAPGVCTKCRGVKRTGLYADGKTVVLRGFARPDGIYEIYVDRVEWRNKDGDVVKVKGVVREYDTDKLNQNEPAETSYTLVNDAGLATASPIILRAGAPGDPLVVATKTANHATVVVPQQQQQQNSKFLI